MRFQAVNNVIAAVHRVVAAVAEAGGTVVHRNGDVFDEIDPAVIITEIFHDFLRCWGIFPVFIIPREGKNVKENLSGWKKVFFFRRLSSIDNPTRVWYNYFD